LEGLFDQIEQIKAPGTLEGGDVLQIGKKFFIGISERTNDNGAEQLINIVGKFGCEGFKVPMRNLLHLKTGVSYLGNDTILIDKELAMIDLFKTYHSIIVDDEETYSANCIRVNDFVVFPKGYPKTLKKLINAGFAVKDLEMSEFRKLDGGLSCLSLRF
jgi:dimethylargininase